MEIDIILEKFLINYIDTYTKYCNVKPTRNHLSDLKKKFKTSFATKNIEYKLFPNNEIEFLFFHDNEFRGDIGENICFISNCFYHPKSKLKVFKKILAVTKRYKKDFQIKKLLIELNPDQDYLINCFSLNGILSYNSLYGKVKIGLKSLAELNNGKVKFRQIKKSDVKKLSKLEIETHKFDKTSRMNKFFQQPSAFDNNCKFLEGLAKRKSAIVATINKEPCGLLGFFENKKEKMAFVACIAVYRKHLGKGISKLLYKRMLTEFSKRGLNYYIGGTTTKNVLALNELLGRIIFKKAFLCKIY